VNLYTTRAAEFVCNPWSVFDSAVVTASLVELVLIYGGLNSGTGINILRTMRVFRIICLFNKVLRY
jgi:hypothetical protein